MAKIILLFLMLIVGQSFAQSKQVQDRITQVENNLIPYVPVKGFKGWNLIDRMKYYKVPGLSIAVIKDYKIDWVKGYGMADTLKNMPVTPETMFSAGSISKLLMAVTALKMVDSQQIDLDKPINTYLTSWKIADNDFTQKKPITLRMLLSHSAGTSQTSYFGFTPAEPLPSITQILSGAKISQTRAVVVNSEPANEFRYSGGGSMIAQLALMDISKKSFSDLTQEILFDKLGMKNSTFEQPVPKKFSNQCSWAYSSASWFKGMPYVYPQQAAAGLYSTPTDLAKLFIDIQKSYLGKGTVLSQAIAKEMLTPQVNVSDGGYKEQMGIGPFLIQRTDNNDPKGVFFEFTGVNAGFLAYGMASVEGGNGVIIMLNSGDNQNGIGKEIRRSVAKVYNWTNFLPTEIQPVNLPDIELDKLVGRYRMSTDEVLYLRKEKNYLVENINNSFDIYCFPVSKDSIIFSDFNIKGFFVRNEKDEVIGLQNIYQKKPMPKMKDDEFSPSEYLSMQKYDEAKKAFAAMNMNEGQITYLAYDLMNKKPLHLKAIKTILDVALEQHPNSSMVHSRWGDYYLKINNKASAIKSYQRALELDPNDQQLKENLTTLAK
ncbi:serine hydrolase [Flectobacillus roseus]|uniref:Serine hydrolase n=1 Tax=Flectobacillus roseus TaxID=502259 RepID=A0ABT6Y7C1_9BACT|nr:serine hydrolase [Flectobacillus roseus]MDI9859374.1 serine hydrolase [Flectobacillus roseus]